MSSITIRNLDEKVKQSLREQAARHGRSMEEEVRQILRHATDAQKTKKAKGMSLWEAVRGTMTEFVDLPPYPRGTVREPPSFDDT